MRDPILFAALALLGVYVYAQRVSSAATANAGVPGAGGVANGQPAGRDVRGGRAGEGDWFVRPSPGSGPAQLPQPSYSFVSGRGFVFNGFFGGGGDGGGNCQGPLMLRDGIPSLRTNCVG